jgi:hypothetical protein
VGVVLRVSLGALLLLTVLPGPQAWGSGRAATASYTLEAEWHLDAAARATGARQATTLDSNSNGLGVSSAAPTLLSGRKQR